MIRLIESPTREFCQTLSNSFICSCIPSQPILSHSSAVALTCWAWREAWKPQATRTMRETVPRLCRGPGPARRICQCTAVQKSVRCHGLATAWRSAVLGVGMWGECGRGEGCLEGRMTPRVDPAGWTMRRSPGSSCGLVVLVVVVGGGHPRRGDVRLRCDRWTEADRLWPLQIW